MGKRIRKKYGLNCDDQEPVINEVKETFKQKLHAKSQRRRRIDQRCKAYKQNRMFQNDGKRFYRELGKASIEVKSPPDMEKVTDFWKGIWETPVNYEGNTWLSNNNVRNDTVNLQIFEKIKTQDVLKALTKSQKWKTPGIDQVTNFWMYQLKCSHPYLASSLNNAIEDPSSTPSWMTNGLTFLIPKSEDTDLPKNYRPITCLSTTYKLLTSILTDSIYSFLDQSKLMPIEQKGCKRGSYGCKDQLLINKMIHEDCHSRKTNLSTAWIDYRKAFDSVPHAWILKCLELYRIDPKITKFLEYNMEQWKTTLILNHTNGTEQSEPIHIRRGIFQGDSLSPLLFCIALFPLTKILNEQSLGTKSSVKRKSLTTSFTWMT